MKHFISRLFIFLAFGASLAAQNPTYPVTAALRALPPFSPNLAEWSDPLNNRLGLSLLLNDRQAPGYQVGLRLRIEGQGVRLTTRPDFLPRGIPLNFGIPVELSAIELAEYFNLDNLIFSGISREQYISQGGLPPGSYSVCFEAIDFIRNTDGPASLPSCAFVQAKLLDPPVVLSPIGTQTPISPQLLFVQWQARHTASFLTNYTVEIFEEDELGGLTPEQIFALQQPFLTETLMGVTSLNVDASFPQLQVGKRYFVRVKAEDPTGAAKFKNDGFSEIAFFTYGGSCPAPDGVAVDVKSFEAAEVNFAYQAGSSGYVVRYRAQLPDANWYEEEVIFNSAELEGLSDSTTYEVQIQSVCGGAPGPFGPIYEFITPARPFDPSAIDCGDTIKTLPKPTNTQPIAVLGGGDVVQIGQFEMKITSASAAGTGGWAGTGQVFVPWLGMRINATFNRLFVNTNKVVYDGNVLAEDDGLSSLKGFVPVDDIVASLDSSKVNFCGDSIVASSSSPTTGYRANDFYASSNPNYASHFVPYNPDAITSGGNQDYLYDPYNPKNPSKPYVASDYTNPNNPYTEKKPYKKTNIWNPFNAFNPYDPRDYNDPANPWTASFAYTPDRMFQKQAKEGSVTAANAFAGGNNLPIALGTAPNMMALYGMKFSPTAAYLNAYASVKVPGGETGKDRLVAFQAIGVGFQANGLQGESMMKMMADVSFDFSNKARLTIRKGKNTFVKFDCYGITQAGVEMDVEFCRDVVIPVDKYTYEPRDDAYVTGKFIAVAPEWGEFTGDLSVTPFELTQLPGWAFTIENAVIDFSDQTTPTSVKFPKKYTHPEVDQFYRDGKNSPGWQGFYLGLARVRLPEALTNSIDSTNAGQTITNTIERDDQGNITGRRTDTTNVDPTVFRDGNTITTIGVQGLIIDRTGFTGDIFATNVFTLEQGRIGGSWAFALDSVAIGFQSNQFHHANLAGKIEIPVVEDPLKYACHIQPGGRYAFSVALTDTLSFSAMGASLDLHKNTEIGIKYRVADKNFSAYAKLYGEATFTPSLGGKKDATTDSGSGGESGSDPKKGKDKLMIPSIAFENFHVTTRAPYVENVGSWALSNAGNDQPSTAGFPITINEVGMFQNLDKTEVAFGIDLTLNLVKSDDQGFGANGRAFIICDVNYDEEEKKQTWKFNRVRLDRLSVDYVGSGFEFHGFIEQFENNLIYGSGFNGGIQASFKPSISVGVVALFGKKDDYRYFFADALVAFDPGIAIGSTGMSLYGFGGGVSYHMERKGFSGIKLPPSNAKEGATEPDTTATAGVAASASALAAAFRGGVDPNAAMPQAVPLPSSLGTSLSGVRYEPNKEVGIGIKAMIAFGTVKREVFNGDIAFEIIFNAGGGMRYIGLSGNANFLTPPKTPAEPNPIPSVSAYVDMGYDFQNDAFSAYLRLKVAVAKGLIRGAYADYVAGEGDIYADKDKWWIYLGTPTKPIKLSFDLSALKNMGKKDEQESTATEGDPPIANQDSTSAKKPLGQIGDVGMLLTAYLDAGSQLPAFPGPPPEVLNFFEPGTFEESGFNPTDRDDPSFANAGGLLFGAGMQVAMPDMTFLIFYAYINAGVGFDVMLKNYGTDAICGNMADSPSPIGINGWYATGQMYAYLEAGVGIQINILGFKGRYPIFDVGAAALLQARLPNPMWMRGAIAGRYSILGGLVSGNCQFDFEAGTLCEIVPGTPDEIQIVQSITPEEEATDVNVFVKPQATFNLPEGRTTILKDEDGRNVSLRPQLQSFNVYVGKEDSRTLVPGELEWDLDRNVVAFRSEDILPGNTEMSVEVIATLEQRYGTGEWEPVLKDGDPVRQTTTHVFTTGAAPEVIVEENVVYTYPVNRQLNFHRSEAGTGYVQLDRGQDYLFLGQPGNGLDAAKWEQKLRFWQDGAAVSSTNFSYNGAENRLNFAIPSPNLQGDKLTYFEVVNVPKGADVDITANVREVEEDLAANLPDGVVADDNMTTILVKTKQAQGTIEGLQEKQLYRADFRASRFATFEEKMRFRQREFTFIDAQALSVPKDTVILADGTTYISTFLGINDFGEEVNPGELMDQYDLAGEKAGVKKIDRLVRAEADLTGTHQDWYGNYPKPNVYDRFPQGRFDRVNWRNNDAFGYPPSKAIKIRQSGTRPLAKLTDAMLSAGTPLPPAENVQLRYHLPYVMYRDFADYWNQVAGFATTNPISADLERFLDWRFVYPNYGNYRTRLQYFLPGKETPNSEVVIDLPYDVEVINKRR